jgi:hypothetical protein
MGAGPLGRAARHQILEFGSAGADGVALKQATPFTTVLRNWPEERKAAVPIQLEA